MMNLINKFICLFFPMRLIKFLIKNKFTKQHPYPESTLIHRRAAKVLFEVEFLWYDKDLTPITIIRSVKGGKIASISYYEMFEFKEYQGRDRNAGNAI